MSDTSNRVTIYQLDRSRSERAIWVMEELDAPYSVEFFTRDANWSAEPAYKALHPLGSSPVIDADGHRIAESGAVVEYLATTQGGGKLALQPDSPDYAAYLYWFHFAESSLMPALVSEIMAERAGLDHDHPSRVYARMRGAELLGYVAKRVETATWFAGERFTAADIMMTFPFTTTRLFMTVDVESYPPILRYLERIEARPAYQRMRAIVDRD